MEHDHRYADKASVGSVFGALNQELIRQVQIQTRMDVIKMFDQYF